jgi:hypothetical protein
MDASGAESVRCRRRMMSRSSLDSAVALAGCLDNVTEARARALTVGLTLLFHKGSTRVSLVP